MYDCVHFLYDSVQIKMPIYCRNVRFRSTRARGVANFAMLILGWHSDSWGMWSGMSSDY